MSRPPYISNGQPRFYSSLAELHRRAAINKTEANKYSAKQWLVSASKLFDEVNIKRVLATLLFSVPQFLAKETEAHSSICINI